MNIKKIRVVKMILIGGGLALVLLFFLSLKTVAEINFNNGEYTIKTFNYLDLSFQNKSHEGLMYVDFNNDGTNEEIEFKNSMVAVFMNEKNIFETDPEWKVEEVLLGDFNNDGKTDLCLYLWKTGSYGTSKPFWIKENDVSYKQHLFLYDWDENQNKIMPLWHSSNLPYINTKTILDDIDGDNKKELVVLEKPYEYSSWQGAKTAAVWRWNEWGFENVWRSKDGKFDDLEISK